MSERRDMERIMKACMDQGLIVSIKKSGHYQVVNPNTGAKIQVAQTPGTHRSLLNNITRLKKIGFIRPRNRG